MLLPDRIRPARPNETEATHDSSLTWAELVAVIGAVLSEDLGEAEHDYALRFLEANLPGGEIAQLIEWPGEWLGNRWFEEAALAPEEIAEHVLGRCGRDLPGQPSDE